MLKKLKLLQNWKVIGIILLAVVLLLVARVYGPKDELSTVEGTTRSGFSPAAAVGNFFGNFFDFDTKKELEQELTAANEELAALKAQSSMVQGMSAENERLRSLLDLKTSNSENWNMVAASVSGREINNWYERFLIDKGSADGIRANMPVVNQDGLVGRTVNVTSHTSEVLLIIDAMGALGGMLQESRIPGVLEGIGGGKGLLTMSNLPLDTSIQLNEVVVTSGEGGVFPAGLLVGSVVKVGSSLDGLSREAVIEPFCDFNGISEVLVMVPVKHEETDEDSDSNNSISQNGDDEGSTDETGGDDSTKDSNGTEDSNGEDDSE